jgi:hypothetical protein
MIHLSNTGRPLRRHTAAGMLLAACLTPACSDGDAENAGTSGGPLYAIMYEMYDDNGEFISYLNLLSSLDVPAIDPAQGREYIGGRAFLRAYNGWVFVGEPATPIVRRYSVSESGALVDERTISFADYGLEAGTIDPWSVAFISPSKAYLFDFKEGVHVIWDPSSMQITGEIPPSPEFFRENLTTDGSPGVVRGNRLYRSLFWANYDTGEYSTDHLLAVFDVDQDRLIETVRETRCPAPGNLAHMDEQQNIYFSNWIWPIAGMLMKDAPPSCVLRIGKDSERFDPDWTLSFSELSGGHQGGMFTYTGDGQALAAVFDESKTSFDAATDPFDYAGSPVWSIWNVDVTTRTGAPVPGIPLSAGAYTPAVLDGRTFLMVPNAGWSSSDLYEVKPDGAVPSLEVPGWSYMFVKVR